MKQRNRRWKSNFLLLGSSLQLFVVKYHPYCESTFTFLLKFLSSLFRFFLALSQGGTLITFLANSRWCKKMGSSLFHSTEDVTGPGTVGKEQASLLGWLHCCPPGRERVKVAQLRFKNIPFLFSLIQTPIPLLGNFLNSVHKALTLPFAEYSQSLLKCRHGPGQHRGHPDE